MHAVRISRDLAQASDLTGRVLCRELRADDGRVAIAKGRVLDDADAMRALELAWAELHLLALDEGDVHEDVAGDRIAHFVAGAGVTVRASSAGHWPIVADHRGLLAIDIDRLRRVNQLDGPCVYSLYDGQVVDTGEVVARAKIIPFAIGAGVLADVGSIFADATGAIHVRAFRPQRVGAVIHASMGDRAIARFGDAVNEKLSWFGSSLGTLAVAGPATESIAEAFGVATRGGTDLILVAGTKAMDVLDPTFEALERIGARMIAHGVPAHPGSLLWLAEWNGVPVVGMPTCGLFAQATVFDLVIARLMTGDRIGRHELAALGHGGFLTRDMAFRLPAYRAAAERGAVE
jgi:hypothetical protein